jgi:3',5'-cyclic AMP phosphodiesterase CpdA
MSIRAYLTLVAGWLLAMAVLAQRSPFTNVDVRPPDSTGHYRLVISGHFHGSSASRSGFPAATLLAGLDTIHALKPNVLLSTGDLFLDAEADIERYRSALLRKLDVALFNAPGNHDAGPPCHPFGCRSGADAGHGARQWQHQGCTIGFVASLGA